MDFDDEIPVEQLQENLVWDEDDTAFIPDDDSEYLDRSFGREY